jgi:hypothetical protein
MMHLEEIMAAVSVGQAGDREAARTQLIALWNAVDDRQTRCAIAHYLADVQDEPRTSWPGTCVRWRQLRTTSGCRRYISTSPTTTVGSLSPRRHKST